MRLVARVCMTLLLLQVCQNPRWRATGCTAARYPISHEADGPSSIAGWAGHHLNHYQLAGSIKMKEREGRRPVMRSYSCSPTRTYTTTQAVREVREKLPRQSSDHFPWHAAPPLNSSDAVDPHHPSTIMSVKIENFTGIPHN